MNRLALLCFLAFAVCLAGCARSPRVPLSTVDAEGLRPLASGVVIYLPPVKSEIGIEESGTGWNVAPADRRAKSIRLATEPRSWIRECAADSFRRAGYVVLVQAPKGHTITVQLTLQEMILEWQTASASPEAVAIIDIQLQVTDRVGTKLVLSGNHEEHAEVAKDDSEGAGELLEVALQRALDDVLPAVDEHLNIHR